jgi:hypothetical protein
MPAAVSAISTVLAEQDGPHPDFTAAEGHLGGWTGPSTITFGKDGKPFYVSGPYDDPRPVVRTLERAVGRGNFDFLVIAE